MELNLVILGGIVGILAASIVGFIAVYSTIKRLGRTVVAQTAHIAKLHKVLSNRQATNAVAENTEIIYNGLNQSIAPITKELDIAPRDTDEHMLWRNIGGLLDEYARNPFVLEQLRRAVKLNPQVARHTNAFLENASKLLRHLAAVDTDGLLAATFTDGLLGQAVTLVSQAKQLAAGK